MDSSVWTAISALASVVLGATSLFLLLQGQRDRRIIADDRRAEQAKRITVSAEHVTQKQDGHSWQILGLSVIIRNDSDRPIFFGPMPTVALYTRPSWRSADDGGNLAADWQTENLELPHGRIDPGTVVELKTESTGVDSARLKFTDTEGNRWVRTSDDGQLFLASHRSSRRSIVYQTLCHLKPLELVLIKWPHTFASWRFRHTKEGVPLMARWIRFWWGCAPIGESDPWMVPTGAPADWPYELWAITVRQLPAQGDVAAGSAA